MQISLYHEVCFRIDVSYPLLRASHDDILGTLFLTFSDKEMTWKVCSLKIHGTHRKSLKTKACKQKNKATMSLFHFSKL